MLAGHAETFSASLKTETPPLPHADIPGYIDANGAVDFAARDQNRLVGNIQLVIARRSPYVNVLDGGTLENVSETLRNVVAERPVMGQSLVSPQFVQDILQCGQGGPTAQVGNTEFTETLGTIRGSGPRVCVKTTRTAFKGSYTSAEDGLKKGLVQLSNSDIRAQLVALCGCKVVVQSTATWSQMFSGETNAVSTPFSQSSNSLPNGPLPDCAVNYSLLKYAINFLNEDLLVEAWKGDTEEPVYKFIGSQEIIELLRTDMDIKEDHRAMTTGQFKAGEAFIKGYTWEGPYRGLEFGIDSQPLRFDYLDGNGNPIYIEPEIAANVSNGVGARINPQWARARFEICMIMGANSFRRRVPSQYMGEGNWKWPAQLVQGELEFVVIRDNTFNRYGDYGNFLYQISRSYQVLRPHHVMAIAFKRCNPTFNLSACVDYSGFSSSASL